jgi:RND family efflux transporter MFP subunit
MTSNDRLFRCLRWSAGLCLLVAVAVVAGCARPTPGPPPKKKLDVKVCRPVIHKVTKTEDFTGRTEPFKYVEVRPQVTGELKNIFFNDGDNVRKDALLFQIDDRLYDAQEKNAKAALEKAKANLAQTRADLERAQAAFAKNVGAQADLDAAVANRDAAIASVDAAQAALELARLNMTWTKITATYAGRLSMRKVDPGNIVTANNTVLTTLIVMDPMYVGFDIDEQTLERRREAIRAGEIPSAREAKLEVQVGLGHQEGFPLKATVIFSDNQLDPGTGTLHIRALIDNPLLRTGLSGLVGSAAASEAEQKELRLLSPNMFVRVRLPLGRPYDSLLIREEAIFTEQEHKNVFVVNEKNIIESRRISPGPLVRSENPDDHRVFRAVDERKPGSPPNIGIARGELIVIGGQQKIKVGDEVNPQIQNEKPVDGK